MERIYLIGNYPLDKQESMERFALMLANGFKGKGYKVDTIRPTVLFGNIALSTITGFGKWLGYIDKWLLFPVLLTVKSFIHKLNKEQTFYYVCDHSNAFYARQLPKAHTAVVCHDVLAIRGALGDKDAYCPASRTGVYLQRWILQNLKKAPRLICVSEFTKRQFLEFLSVEEQERFNCKVILNGFNAPFAPLKPELASTYLSNYGLTGIPFILHVGSRLPRKNRKLLIKLLKALGTKWKGVVVFAGQPMDHELLALANDLGLRERIIEVVKPDHQTLQSLYSKCEAFIFPSYAEGFGWPVIEAQACGAPVIASNRQPMPEVSGGAALHADPDDPESFANMFLQLQNAEIRHDLIQRGFKNCQRFALADMIDAYLRIHNLTV